MQWVSIIFLYIFIMKTINRLGIIFLVLFLNVFFSSAIFPESNESKAAINSEYIFPLQGKHVHSSSIVELPNGDLLSCWFEGSGERTANDVAIKGARLKKGKSTWSEPFIMADTPGLPDCNPVLFIDGKNRLQLIWIVVVGNEWEASVLKTRISTNYQNDGVPVWSWQDNIFLKPGNDFTKTLEKGFKELNTPEFAWGAYAKKYEDQLIEASKSSIKRETGWMPRIQPTTLPNGRILFPVYSDGFNLSMVAISDDQGDTWSPSLPIVGRGNVQPAIVCKKDGTLVAYMRDGGDYPGRIMISESKDNGYTWSVARKTEILNPGASVDAISLKNGQWAMVYNNTVDDRHNLVVSLSDDEGKTWKWTKYLENTEKGSYGYPCMIQAKDGKIHISYSYSLNNEKTIKHVYFTEDWLRN